MSLLAFAVIPSRLVIGRVGHALETILRCPGYTASTILVFMGTAPSARLGSDPVGAGQRARAALVVVVHRSDTKTSPLTCELAQGWYRVVDLPIERPMIERLNTLRPDVVVVDLHRLTFDVVRLCRDISTSVACRIIVVDDRTLNDRSVVEVLDAGADDVVSADLSTTVLDARVRVALRARPATSRALTDLIAGDVLIDQSAHCVYVAGEVVRCPPVQFALLVALAGSPNRLILSDELLSLVWGAHPGDVHPRRLRIAVSVLRGILGSGPSRPVIETIPRVGYRLFVPTDVGR